MKNKTVKNMLIYIKYPYTALVIATMWIGIAIIISKQNGENLELLISLTALCTLFIAYRGFRIIK